MSEFHELQVDDHISLLSGFPFSSDYFDQQEGIRLIRIRDLVGSGDETFYRGVFDSRWLVKPRDILIGMDGDFNIVRWKGDEALLNQRILKADAKFNGLIDQGFFYYWCGPLLVQIHNRTAATTVKHLSIKSIEKAKGLFPPKSAQHRIAEILSTVDEAITQTEALIAKYQQIKAGLMHDLFTRGVTPDGHLRPTRIQASHLYRESPLGWIPKEWEVRPLRDIATYQHGQPFPSTDYSDEGVLLLRPGNLHVSGVVRFDATHTTRIPQRWLRDCPELTVKQNDIVMNLTAQSLEDQFLGRVCIVKDGEPSLLNQRIARFFPRQVDHHFLYWILRSLQFRNQIDRTAQGTKVQHIYNSDLNRVMFAIPKSQQEQERVAGLLLTATESLVAGESSIAKLCQQKHGLMHDLLTGRVRVMVAEAASV